MTMAGAFCLGSSGHGGSLAKGAKSRRRPSNQTFQTVRTTSQESMTTTKGLTSRTRGVSIERMIGSLKPYLLGWRSYFGFSQDPLVFRNLDARIRRRLRMVIWRQWGKGPTRYVKSAGINRHVVRNERVLQGRS